MHHHLGAVFPAGAGADILEGSSNKIVSLVSGMHAPAAPRLFPYNYVLPHTAVQSSLRSDDERFLELHLHVLDQGGGIHRLFIEVTTI